MSNQELGAVVFAGGYLVLAVIAVRTLGIRRVLWAIGLIVFFAVTVAFKSLAVIIGTRRR